SRWSSKKRLRRPPPRSAEGPPGMREARPDYPVCVSAFPVIRLRRLRRTRGIRSLVRETRLDLDDFVMPLFVGPAGFANEELPGLGRHSVETLVAEAEELERLGVRAVILFGIPE